jgi:hypothetical protein
MLMFSKAKLYLILVAVLVFYRSSPLEQVLSMSMALSLLI